MRLGVVLARQRDLALAIAMTRAALRAGDDVRWFAMDEGVLALTAPLEPAGADELDGLEVIACATSVDQRGVALPPQIALGSQDDHAALLSWADRTVSLT